MGNTYFEADARRLRLSGAFADDEVDMVRAAVDSCGRSSHGCLTADLTAVIALGPAVAEYLVDAKAEAEAENRRMTLLRKLDTPADRALNAAARRRKGPRQRLG